MLDYRRIAAFAAGQAVLLVAVAALRPHDTASIFGFGVVVLILSTTAIPRRSLVDARAPVILALAVTQGWLAAFTVAFSSVVAEVLAKRRLHVSGQLGLLIISAAGIVTGRFSGLPLLAIVALIALVFEVIREPRDLLEQSRLLMLASAVSVSLLTIVLIQTMGDWSIFIVGIVLFVMQHAMRLYSEVEQAYEATILATADAVEVGSPGKTGHSRRVADLSDRVGRFLRLGRYDAQFLHRLALLHELRLGDAVPSGNPFDGGRSVTDIACFRDVLPVLSTIHGRCPLDGHLGLLAYVVCKASNVDEVISGSSSRGDGWFDEDQLQILATESDRARADRAFRRATA